MTDKACILIVDDRPEKVLSLEVVLEALGQEIVRAYSGREALRQVLAREFAVILLDVNMPGMDGFETAQLIRQRKHSEHVPIIFVTAFGDEMHAARGYSLGAVDYILAPVMPEVLRSKVGVFVDLFVKNAQLRSQAESLRRRAMQLQKLAAASVAINSAQSLEKMLQTITDSARDIVGAHQAITLFLGDRRTGAFPGMDGCRTHAAASLSEKYASWRSKPLKLDAVANTLVAQSAKPTRMTEAELRVHPDWEIVSALDIPPVRGGMLAAPLQSREGENLGVIYIADRFDGDFSADDEAVLVQLSQMGSITIENTLYADEREANRIKDEFLATLSHELRTPLNAMVGWTELLRTEELTGEVAHGLEVIERNVHAQTKLVEDLLDVSRITTGKLRISRQPLALSLVVEAAVDACRPPAKDKKVIIHAVLQPVRETVGDPNRLQQVVWNLLSNAIKFTPESGRVQVTLNEVETPAGAMAEIHVSDNGMGIEPQFLPYVFDRFRQADSSSTRRQGGLGIGLTIVRHIVNLHGGTVHVSSAGKGTGSTFTVRLPLKAVEAGPPSSEGDPHPEPAILDESSTIGFGGVDLAGMDILLVEDEQDARLLLAEVLRRAGANVAAAANAEEAFGHFLSAPPDVIVSDIAMPGEDGHSLIRRIRQLGAARGGDLPALAVSAYAREEDKARALGAGFNDHLAKPVSPGVLLSKLARIAEARAEKTLKLG